MSAPERRLRAKRSSTIALAVLFEYYEDCLREDTVRGSRSRRPSLPVIHQQAVLNTTSTASTSTAAAAMSSVGHTKARRPSLVEFHDAMVSFRCFFVEGVDCGCGGCGGGSETYRGMFEVLLLTLVTRLEPPVIVLVPPKCRACFSLSRLRLEFFLGPLLRR
ncbi:hypothetical protein Y032_0217g2390 [Ancylostoma ceylanicum]|uniref:Uncharacterized protein n=1 Tax=Ancylostoma ceylanicum TaxID=53326 RepID=A0A016SJU7_9BILA|nr:hypothetical protein Y032_0217g2390 [Ancylostoma ceylanicum]